MIEISWFISSALHLPNPLRPTESRHIYQSQRKGNPREGWRGPIKKVGRAARRCVLDFLLSAEHRCVYLARVVPKALCICNARQACSATKHTEITRRPAALGTSQHHSASPGQGQVLLQPHGEAAHARHSLASILMNSRYLDRVPTELWWASNFCWMNSEINSSPKHMPDGWFDKI